jgi:hypothetical protein
VDDRWVSDAFVGALAEIVYSDAQRRLSGKIVRHYEEDVP